MRSSGCRRCTGATGPHPKEVRTNERQIEREVKRFQIGVRAAVALNPDARVNRQRASDVAEGELLLSIWTDPFHQPADDARIFLDGLLNQVRDKYIESDWYDVYDLVEFIVVYPTGATFRKQLIAACNAVLEKHVSAYRFVGTIIAPITSEEEIAAVETAMSHGDLVRPVVVHLDTALARFRLST